MCPPALYCCVRLCLAILYICLPALGCSGRLCLAILCLPALDVASSSFDFEKHKLFGVYGGVISVGHVAFLFICLAGLSLLVSALFPWPCRLSVHCWCPPFSAGHVAFLFICLPGLSLLCIISMHLSASSVTRGVRPVSVSVGHVAFLFICLPVLSLLVSARPFSAGDCLPGLSVSGPPAKTPSGNPGNIQREQPHQQDNPHHLSDNRGGRASRRQRQRNLWTSHCRTDWRAAGPYEYEDGHKILDLGKDCRRTQSTRCFNSGWTH